MAETDLKGFEGMSFGSAAQKVAKQRPPAKMAVKKKTIRFGKKKVTKKTVAKKK